VNAYWSRSDRCFRWIW